MATKGKTQDSNDYGDGSQNKKLPLDLLSRILQAATKQKLDDIFEEYHKGGVLRTGRGSKRRNVFHEILEQWHVCFVVVVDDDDDDDDDNGPLLASNPPDRVQEFWEHLVIHYPELLGEKDRDKRYPLHRAADKCKPLVFVTANLIVPKATLDQLKTKCPNRPSSSTSKCSLRLMPRIKNKTTNQNKPKKNKKNNHKKKNNKKVT